MSKLPTLVKRIKNELNISEKRIWDTIEKGLERFIKKILNAQKIYEVNKDIIEVKLDKENIKATQLIIYKTIVKEVDNEILEISINEAQNYGDKEIGDKIISSAVNNKFKEEYLEKEIYNILKRNYNIIKRKKVKNILNGYKNSAIKGKIIKATNNNATIDLSEMVTGMTGFVKEKQYYNIKDEKESWFHFLGYNENDDLDSQNYGLDLRLSLQTDTLVENLFKREITKVGQSKIILKKIQRYPGNSCKIIVDWSKEEKKKMFKKEKEKKGIQKLTTNQRVEILNRNENKSSRIVIGEKAKHLKRISQKLNGERIAIINFLYVNHIIPFIYKSLCLGQDVKNYISDIVFLNEGVNEDNIVWNEVDNKFECNKYDVDIEEVNIDIVVEKGKSHKFIKDGNCATSRNLLGINKLNIKEE